MVGLQVVFLPGVCPAPGQETIVGDIIPSVDGYFGKVMLRYQLVCQVFADPHDLLYILY